MSISEKLKTIAQNQVEIFEAGRHKGQYDRDYLLWSCLTRNGERKDFAYTFRNTDFSGYSFIKPIAPSGTSASASYMFKLYKGVSLPDNLDLSKISTTATHGDLFFESKLTYIPDIKIPSLNAYQNSFYKCADLKKIEILRVCEDTSFFQTFYGCSALEEIRFQGVIGKSIDFSDCKNLTSATLVHIIGKLKNYAGTDITRTLTLGSSNLDKLTNSQQQKVLDKGWILV